MGLSLRGHLGKPSMGRTLRRCRGRRYSHTRLNYTVSGPCDPGDLWELSPNPAGTAQDPGVQYTQASLGWQFRVAGEGRVDAGNGGSKTRPRITTHIVNPLDKGLPCNA